MAYVFRQNVRNSLEEFLYYYNFLLKPHLNVEFIENVDKLL